MVSMILGTTLLGCAAIFVAVLGLESRAYRAMPDFAGRVSVAGLLVIALVAGVALALNSLLASMAFALGWLT